MTTALLVLAPGFEEIEAVTPIDVLRRAGVEVVGAGVEGTRVEGAHGIVIEADTTLADAPEADVLILPGGLPGAQHLRESPAVQARLEAQRAAGKRIAAICAAPALALTPSGVLDGKQATCYPGFEERFGETTTFRADRVVVDGDLTTSRGPGTALEFALSLVEQLVGPDKAAALRDGMLVK